MKGHFRVKNWRQFQHYKDRNPPWIKLHFALLSSEDWVNLDDASRVLAVACMLVASRNEGLVPANPAYMKRVAYLNRPPNFIPLIECGFLEDASECLQMLANARPETYKATTDKATYKATEKKATTTVAALPDWLPADAWDAWLEVRRKNRAPNTARALNLALRELARLKADGQDPLAVLEQSTLRGWRGVFPVANANGGNFDVNELIRELEEKERNAAH